MRTSVRLFQVGLLAVFLAPLFSCGSGWISTPNSNVETKTEPLVSVSLTEHNLTLGAGETHQFDVTVTGSSDTGITWSLSGCTGDACGSISSSGLYAAPSIVLTRVLITLTATASADPNKVDQAGIELIPVAVSVSPASAWVVPGGTQIFTAVVKYDILNAGVTWTLGSACSSNCGTLNNIGPASVTYTAPVNTSDSSSLKLIASSVSDPSKKAEIHVALAEAGGMTEGDYAFAFSGWETTIADESCWVCEVIAAGRFHADAAGNITEGVEDINSQSGVTKALPFTGSYKVGADGCGTFTFTSTLGSATYHMVLDASKTKGKFIRVDALQDESSVSGSGYFELQDKAAFSLAALAGPYAFGVSGMLGANRQAAVGRFETDASGVFTGGSADMTQQMGGGWDSQISSTNLKLAGLLGAPSVSTGRGTATLNWGSLYNFAYYVVSDQKILLVQLDARNDTTPLLKGHFQRQKGPFSAASFSTPAIFSMAGVWLDFCGFEMDAAIGQMSPDGSGSVNGTYDYNWETQEQPFAGSYTVAPNGRSELSLKTVSADTRNHVAYFYGPNEAFLMETSGTDVLFGRLRPQTGAPFSEASLSGTYLTHTGPPAGDLAENDSGLTTFDGVGGLTANVDVDDSGNLRHLEFTGTYTLAPNGRGTFIFSSPADGTAVFWVISPTELVSIGTTTTASDFSESGALLEYEE